MIKKRKLKYQSLGCFTYKNIIDFWGCGFYRSSHGFKNKKTIPLDIFSFLNIAIVISWIYYRQIKNPHLSLFGFKASIVTSLTQLN